MTSFEHGMLGGSVALLLGCHKRQGWSLVVTAGIGATLPDWDGVSIVFGGAAYAEVHRVWGHNFLVASCTGALAGIVGYLAFLSAGVRRKVERLLPAALVTSNEPVPSFSKRTLAIWMSMCILASVSHLPADMMYSGHREMSNWPLKLLWPFSQQGWVWPIVAWGDVATTLIFIAEMFALARWPRRGQSIALMALVALGIYVGVRWWLGGIAG